MGRKRLNTWVKKMEIGRQPRHSCPARIEVYEDYLSDEENPRPRRRRASPRPAPEEKSNKLLWIGLACCIGVTFIIVVICLLLPMMFGGNSQQQQCGNSQYCQCGQSCQCAPQQQAPAYGYGNQQQVQQQQACCPQCRKPIYGAQGKSRSGLGVAGGAMTASMLMGGGMGMMF